MARPVKMRDAARSDCAALSELINFARGLGVGTKLMQWAEQSATELGLRGISLIVSDGNPGARKLYDRIGYEEVASRPMVKEQWRSDGRNWVPMIKQTGQA